MAFYAQPVAKRGLPSAISRRYFWAVSSSIMPEPSRRAFSFDFRFQGPPQRGGTMRAWSRSVGKGKRRVIHHLSNPLTVSPEGERPFLRKV